MIKTLKVSLTVGFLLVLFSMPSIAWAQQSDAAAAISVSQRKLLQCFDAAKNAESAGANISSLTLVLNRAGSLLSEAQLAYSQGNFASAADLASQSQSSLDGVISVADGLKSSAVAAANLENLFFIGSIVGTFVVIGGGVAVWMLLNRKYGENGVKKVESDAA